MNQALLYLRVSSREQEKEGFSLDAQEKLGIDYALRKGLKIAKVYKVSESAWREERTAFNLMIDYAKRHSEIGHIIFDVTDRMTRNDFDKLKIYTLIKEHGKTVHFSRSNKIIDRNSGSEDVFMLDIEVAVAKKMSNDISRKTRMGMQEKAEQGFYPSVAPFGYTNNRLTGLLEIDEAIAPFIKRMFELMASGSHSHQTLSEQLAKEGMRNKNGNKCGKSAIAHFLHNPIYYGCFRWKGRLIQGSHPPIISKDLFDKVQDILSGKSKIHIQRKGFAFNNLILCGVCGCKVIGEKKKARYHYYHCTFSKGRHEGKVYLREEKLSELFAAPVKDVTLDKDTASWIFDTVCEENKGVAELQDKRLAALKASYEKVNTRISKLYDAKFDNEITEEGFIAKEREYQGQLIQIKAQTEELQKVNPHFAEDAQSALELSKRMYPLYVRSNYEEKAKLLQLLASNFTLIDVSPIPTYKEPFSFFHEKGSRTEWLPGQGSNLGHTR